MSEHKADVSAHHAKYTDEEAVAAADASNEFIERNVNNDVALVTTLKIQTTGSILKLLCERGYQFISTTIMSAWAKSTSHTYNQIYAYIYFPSVYVVGTDTNVMIGSMYFKKAGGVNNSSLTIKVANTTPTAIDVIEFCYDKIINKKVVFIESIKSGATQAGAGAAANEVWKTSGHATLPDNVLMIGV